MPRKTPSRYRLWREARYTHKTGLIAWSEMVRKLEAFYGPPPSWWTKDSKLSREKQS